MHNPTRRVALFLFCLGAGCLDSSLAYAAVSVEKWGRHVISLRNDTYSGNPFEIQMDATFTHSGTGTTITIPGYYAGNGTWRVGFMPTVDGEWTYRTTSADSDLNGSTGTVICTDSDRRGLLEAAPSHDRKWKFADGPYAVPIALRIDFFFENASQAEFEAAADFLSANHIHMMDTRLQDEASSTMMVFEGDPSNHRFNLALWDQMEARMDALAQRQLGAYVMFYADDTGKPQWSGQSPTESLLIRYAVARLAGYPILFWDTGIDIAEYRTQSDVDWFGDRLRELDPYGHPVSSRIGGGSGSLWMAGRTYDSRGDRQAYIDDMVGYFADGSRPIAMFDAWGENYNSKPEKSFRPADIRRSIWKSVAAGGLAVMYRGDDGYFHLSDVASDLESEQWLRLVNPFIQKRLGETFGTMTPAASLVSNGYALADPSRSKILIYSVGPNDKWDTDHGGDLTLRLADLSDEYTGIWFDPRTGEEKAAGSFYGGSDRLVPLPTADDWVLLLELTSQVADRTPPSPPSTLIAR